MQQIRRIREADPGTSLLQGKSAQWNIQQGVWTPCPIRAVALVSPRPDREKAPSVDGEPRVLRAWKARQVRPGTAPSESELQNLSSSFHSFVFFAWVAESMHLSWARFTQKGSFQAVTEIPAFWDHNFCIPAKSNMCFSFLPIHHFQNIQQILPRWSVNSKAPL